MIKYNLKCKNKHEFESWFSDSKEFEKLLKKKLIECAFCKTKSIKKSIMSPRIAHKKKVNFPNKEIRQMKKDLLKLRKFVEKNFDYVGDNFPREVRKVYYDKKKNKNIYGIASPKETEELKEEGIDLATIPWIDNKEN
tara:strand:+ start:1063 stop:1476 length:414 start_codon:yes stop_codon:yes gene_type:complete